jgi:hypothetical protein
MDISNTFIQKIELMICEHREIIKRSVYGTSILIYNCSRFEIEVLPFYFKYYKFASFVRQMKVYGFTTVVRTDGLTEFIHEDILFYIRNSQGNRGGKTR